MSGDALSGQADARPHPDDSAISAIHNKLRAVRAAPDVSALLQDLYEVVDVALDTETPNLKEPSARYDLSRIDVSRLQAEFAKTPFKNLVTLNLIEKLQQRLAAMMARNPTRVNLYARYQTIVQAYNQDKDAAAIQKVMDDLFALNDTCGLEEKRYLREGLESEEQLAVFDLLQKASLTRGERESIKQVARELLDRLTGGKLQIDRWREKATAQAQVKSEIITHLFTHLPAAYDEDEIELKAGAVFAHLYGAGLSRAGLGSGAHLYH
jgi:type I restriction enzyme, R subunit